MFEVCVCVCVCLCTEYERFKELCVSCVLDLETFVFSSNSGRSCHSVSLSPSSLSPFSETNITATIVSSGYGDQLPFDLGPLHTATITVLPLKGQLVGISVYSLWLIMSPFSVLSLCAQCVVNVQVVPEGIESVNGSSETMGCTSPLEDSGGLTVCRSPSFLVDGCSPDIDTSTSDWASQLVTVRRNEGTPDIHFAHVLLTFGFETPVFFTGIEIDLFHCPEQGIGAPRFTTYLNQEYSLDFSIFSLIFLPVVQPPPVIMQLFVNC